MVRNGEVRGDADTDQYWEGHSTIGAGIVVFTATTNPTIARTMNIEPQHLAVMPLPIFLGCSQASATIDA
jgi:hypothetical protein